jgi:hypothetical protein
MPGFRSPKKMYPSLLLLLCLILTACNQSTPTPQEMIDTLGQIPSSDPSTTDHTASSSPVETTEATESNGLEPGHTSWINRYQDNLPAFGHYVLPTSDGASLVLAWREGAPWVLKIAADGSVLWQEIVYVFGLHSMIETVEGNYVLFGPYDIVSMDRNGQLLWQRSFGREIDQSASIGVIISRATYIGFDQETGGWLIGDDFGLLSQVDPQGMPTHQTYYGGRPFYPDSLTHMSPTAISTAAQDDQGTFIIEHYSLNDSNHWRRTLGFGMHDLPVREPYFLVSGDEQGGLLFGGPVYSYLIDGGVDLVLVKLDTSGEIEWQRVIAGTTTMEDVNAYRLRDGGFLITATRWGFYAIENDYLPYLWLIRLDAGGNVLWQRILGDGTSTIRIRHAAENQVGGLVLTGGISPGESYSTTDETDLLLIQLDANGQIPGCSWIQTIEHDVETIVTSSNLAPLEAITHEQANFTWSEDDWDSPTSTSAVPEQLCMTMADSAEPTPTLDPMRSVPTQSNQPYAFLNAEGYIFGGVRNNQWIDAATAYQALTSGQEVTVYTNSALAGQSTITLMADPGEFDCGSAPQFDLNPGAAWMYSIATTGFWQASLRQPSLMDSTTSPYSDVLKQVLNDLGLADPMIQFLTLQRVDLEGDGTDEVVMTAYRQITGSGSTTVSSGDYSLVILRRVVGNEVINIPLVSDVYLHSASNTSPINYRVIGMLDLDADGVLEIVIQGTSQSELVIFVFDLTAPTYDPVLSLSCMSP